MGQNHHVFNAPKHFLKFFYFSVYQKPFFLVYLTSSPFFLLRQQIKHSFHPFSYFCKISQSASDPTAGHIGNFYFFGHFLYNILGFIFASNKSMVELVAAKEDTSSIALSRETWSFFQIKNIYSIFRPKI